MKHWKTLLTIVLMIIAMVFNWSWIWSVFILMSLLYMFNSNEIHIVETIKKSESPRMYWFTFVFLLTFNVVLILIYLNILEF